MIRNTRKRRFLAGGLVVLGALLMLLAPNTWVGGLVMGAGILVELLGITLERGGRR